MTYMATPLHKNPCSGDHEIYSCERQCNIPWLSLLYTLSVWTFPQSRELTLKVRGHEIYNLLSSKTYRYYILNLVKIGPLVLENMLTNGAHRTTTNGNQ